MRRKAASAMVVLTVIAVIAVVASSVYVGYQVSLYSSRISSLESSLQSLNRTLSAQASALSSLYSQQQSIEASLNFPAVAVDATGQQIVVYSMPTRIVSLMPSDTALLFAVGAGPQVVGVDKYSNWPPYLQALESNGTIKDIGSGWYPDPEVILSARPDIVFGVSSVPSNYALKQQFAAYGIPVVLLPDNTIEDVVQSIYTVGKLTGHEATAQLLAENLTTELRFAESRVVGLSPVPTALIVWPSPIWVAGNGTWEDQMITVAGGLNVFSNISGWEPVNPEALLAEKPQVIIYTAGHGEFNYTKFMSTLYQELGPAANSVPAIANGRVYAVTGAYNDWLTEPGPFVGDGTILLSVLIHPEAYGMNYTAIPHVVSPETFSLPVPSSLPVISTPNYVPAVSSP
ncbi:MAG: ABC transporter substrate-binding protein [Conexivisphaera sp.]|jgi:iron complex transport system substrate-binding protein